MRFSDLPIYALLSFLWLFGGLSAKAEEVDKKASFSLATVSSLFWENQGQIRDNEKAGACPEIAYYFQQQNRQLYFGKNRLSYVLNVIEREPATLANEPQARQIKRYRFDLELIGSNSNAQILGKEPQKALVNYYLGKDSRWVQPSAFNKLLYQEIYPGIDMLWYTFGSANQSHLKYDYIVAPGANPAAIQWRFRGVEQIELTPEGAVCFVTPAGKLCETKPYAYQLLNNGEKKEISAGFGINKEGILSFVLGDYDRSLPLIIDPAVDWSTYWGGNAADEVYDMAYQAQDNALLVVGSTLSSNFPIQLGWQSNNAGAEDVFISRHNATTGALIWATYFGGTGNEIGFSLALGAQGFYVAGTTTSPNLPLGGGFYQVANQGNTDFFLSRFSANGSLEWATYFGGSGQEVTGRITLDEAENIYITGRTTSANFPTQNPIQSNNAGGLDAILAKFNSSGALLWSTYFGGSQDDYGTLIALQPGTNNAALVGWSRSSNLPITGGFQPLYGGGFSDGYILTFNTQNGQKGWGTYFGGNDQDYVNSAAYNGNTLYFAGSCASTNIPLVNAVSSSLGGGLDAFLGSLQAASGTRNWVRPFGGNGEDNPRTLKIDEEGLLYVSGWTLSSNLPLVAPVQNANGGGWDSFIAKFNPSNGAATWSTYYGGGGEERLQAAALAPGGILFIGGRTASANYPLVNPIYNAYSGNQDIFLTRFNTCDIKPQAPVLTPKDACIGQSVTLSTTSTLSPGQRLRWYNALSAASPIAESVTPPFELSIAALPPNTTYYAAIYDDNTGCASSRAAQTIASGAVNVRIRNLPPTVCITTPNIELEAEPTGGTFSGPAVAGNIFSPSQLNPGKYQITYTGIFNGCPYQANFSITVERVAPRFVALPETVCTNLTRLTLIGHPEGGNFSGPSVSGNIFQPSILAPGLYTLTYSGVAANGCAYATSQDIYVDTLNVELSGLASHYCTTSPAVTLSGTPSNGVYSGAGITNNNEFAPATLPPGEYPITYSGVFKGCPYSVTRLVTINAPVQGVAISGNAPICEGAQLNLQVPFIPRAAYQWRGPAAFADTRPNPSIANATTANSGEYSLTISVPGCPLYSATFFAAINRLPASLGVVAVPSAQLCRGDNLLLVAPNLPGARYRWSGPGGFSASSSVVSRNTVTPLEEGRYSVIVTVEGCPGSLSETLQIFVNTPPQITLASNSPVCENGVLRLTASGPANVVYLWNGPGGWQAVGAFPTISPVTLNENGVYTLTALVSGCQPAVSTLRVTVNAIPSPVFAAASSPICAGQALALTAFAPSEARLSWRGPNNFTSSSPNPIISNAGLLASGAYTVTATVAGCPSATAVAEAIVTPIPAAPVITGKTTVCEGDSINFSLTTQPGVIYTWMGPNGLSLNANALQLPNAAASNAGLYSVYGVYNGCTSAIARIPLNVVARPAPLSVSYSGPVCAGGNFQLFAQTVQGITYKWRGPGGWSAFTQNPVYFNAPLSAAGVYTLTAAYGDCESQEATLQVEILPVVEPNAITSNSPVCQGSLLRLSAPILAGATYNWRGPGGFTSTQSNPTRSNFAIEQAGVYSLTAIVGPCTTQQTVNVLHTPKPNTPAASSNTPVCAGAPLAFTSATVAGATYLWQGPGGYSSSLQNPTRAVTEPEHTGEYALRVVVAGCTSDARLLSARVWPKAEAKLLTPNVTICQGSSATLSFQLRGAGPWSLDIQPGARISVGSATSLNPSNHNVNLSPTTTTSYFIGEIRDANNCRFSLNQNAVVSVTPLPLASITVNGRPCQGQSLELIGGAQSPEGSYFWEGPNGLTATTPNITINSLSGAQAGNYSLIRIIDGCSSRAATYNLPLNGLPSATISSAVQNACLLNPTSIPITFTGASPWNLTYRINSEAPITINGITTSPYNLSITPQTLGQMQIHLVNVTDNSGCGDGTLNGLGTIRVSDRPALRVLSKTDANCGASGGSITLAASGGTGSNYRYSIDNVNFSTRNFFSNLNPGAYTFYVTDGVCLGAASVTINGTVGTVILSSQASVNSVIVNWQPVPNTPSYNVRYREIGSAAPAMVISNITGTTATITGLKPGTRYEIEVQANCSGGGASAWSEPITVQTLGEAPTPCAVPVGITIDRITATTARASWAPSTSAVCYALSYGLLSENPDTWVTAVLASNVTVSDILNLAPGHAYGFRIRANCQICSSRSGNLSPWSSIQNFNTLLAKKENLPTSAISAIIVYPNPGKDYFNLEAELAAEEAKLDIVNAEGRLVYTQNLTAIDGKNQWQIDIGDLPTGIYKLTLRQGALRYSTTWLVAR